MRSTQWRNLAAAVSTAWCALILCAGCTRTPESADVARYLTSSLGDDAPYRVAQIVIDTAPGTEGRLLVTFKADLLAEAPLYERASTTEILEKAGWKEAELDNAIRSAAELPSDLAARVDKSKPVRAVDIVLLTPSVTAGDKRVWHGTVETRYVENRWDFSSLRTEKREPFTGSRKNAFPSDAFVMGSSDAAKVVADAIAARKSYVEAVAWAQANLKERVQRGQAEARAVSEAKARQAAEYGKQKSLSARRQVPLRVMFRRAVMGRGAVAVVQNASAESLDLRLTISDRLKTVQRLIRIRPAGTIEIGWAQGWDFKSGDVLAFEHRDYLPAKFRTP